MFDGLILRFLRISHANAAPNSPYSAWKKRTESWSNRIINIEATELLLSEWEKKMRADKSARELLQLYFLIQVAAGTREFPK